MAFSTRCVLAPSAHRHLDALQAALDAGDVHSFAVGGPTPATTALHLALDHLRTFAIADWPAQEVPDSDGDDDRGDELGSDPAARGRTPGRQRERPSVLIVTRDRTDWHWDLTDQSDVWIARHGGSREVTELLRHVYIRCVLN